MVLGMLLAFVRLFLVLLASVLDVSRVDRSTLPFLRWMDKGYLGFYGMVLLPEGYGRYFRITREEQEWMLE